MGKVVSHAYVTRRSDGKYDVWINGRDILEASGLGKQAAISRAEVVIKNMGGGQITIEDENGKMIKSYFVD